MLYLPTIMSILEVLAVTIPVLLTVAFITIAERKTMASMQRRLGPNSVGWSKSPWESGIVLTSPNSGQLLKPLLPSRYIKNTVNDMYHILVMSLWDQVIIESGKKEWGLVKFKTEWTFADLNHLVIPHKGFMNEFFV